MKSFVEIRFPSDISYGSSGGPEYYTDVISSFNGYEQRNVNWSVSRSRYNVASGVKTKVQLEQLIAFFRARKGKAIGFRFKDWTDFRAHNEKIAIADGIETSFQLCKNYFSGEGEEKRIITKPVADTVKIYLNEKASDLKFEVNYSKGIVNFFEPPRFGLVISASFEFDVPVRFDTDYLPAHLNNYGSYSLHNIPLIEVKI
jgi:uncharacterized protein (TIGR02217 family)